MLFRSLALTVQTPLALTVQAPRALTVQTPLALTVQTPLALTVPPSLPFLDDRPFPPPAAISLTHRLASPVSSDGASPSQSIT